uniref:Uncharacterized protein n=1 Tax=Rhizophora mucronata TaxID=61149 RepID=A0A2P2IK26_RHIMU
MHTRFNRRWIKGGMTLCLVTEKIKETATKETFNYRHRSASALPSSSA